MEQINREELARLAFLNSKRLPQVIDDGGVRKRWVGIGWVDEGAARGDENAQVVGEEPKAPAKKSRK